jgi:hypothetical protein
LYTVIIQSEQTAQQGADCRRLLFEDLIERGELDFCTWKPTGDTVDTVLPELYDLIAGKREWRAVIVQTEVDRTSERMHPSKPNNPFDFIESDDRDPYEVTEIDIPLIRLTQLLGGVPEPELAFRSELVEEEGMAPRVLYRPEEERNKRARKAYSELTQKYQFLDNRPREILVISTRLPVDTSVQEVESAWSTRLESESSEFWHRNRYPSRCRFMVADVVNERHSLYSGSMFRLWCGVLLLALNQVEASSLQAYRLYHLSVRMDLPRLSAALSDYDTRMAAMLAQLEAARANRETLEYQAMQTAPKVEAEVTVTFTSHHDQDLMVDTKPLGLTRDHPKDEAGYWNERFHQATAALNDLLRGPARTLDVAADDTRRRGEYPSDQVGVLNRYQHADLEEELERIYFQTLDERSQLGFRVERRQQEREVIDHQVRRRIGQRLTGKRVLIGLGLGVGAVALSWVPYLTGASSVSTSALLWALLPLLLTLGVLGIFGLAELWIQRREMADAMADHNRLMYDTVREVQSSAKHYTAYLSQLCSYLRGRSYLDQEEILLSSRANANELNQGHRNSIGKCRRLVRSWGVSLGAEVVTQPGDRNPGFDALIPAQKNPAYRFPQITGGRRIPLNTTGEEMTSPYDFIESITLEREELYDDDDRVRNS